MVSTCPLISNSSSPFTKPLGIVSSTVITIIITITNMVNSNFSSLARSRFFFHFHLILLYGLPRGKSLLFTEFTFCWQSLLLLLSLLSLLLLLLFEFKIFWYRSLTENFGWFQHWMILFLKNDRVMHSTFSSVKNNRVKVNFTRSNTSLISMFSSSSYTKVKASV